MSDCGVCLYTDMDEVAEDWKQELRPSDGTVKCDECRKVIPAGEEYEKTILYFSEEEESEENDDDPPQRADEYETCLVCAEIATAFMCEGRAYGGFLWELMDDVMSELTTSCFNKLKTPAAKAELQRRWIESKNLKLAQ